MEYRYILETINGYFVLSISFSAKGTRMECILYLSANTRVCLEFLRTLNNVLVKKKRTGKSSAKRRDLSSVFQVRYFIY